MGVLFVLVLIATSSGAAADLTVSRADAPGPGQTTAALGVLLLDQPPLDSNGAWPRFNLVAHRIHVVEDRAAISVDAGSRQSVLLPPEVYHESPGRLVGIDNGPSHSLWVMPLPGGDADVTLDHGRCAGVWTPEDASVQRQSHVDHLREEYVFDLSESLSWSGCKETTATVTGDLFVVLWSWTAQLHGSNGTTTLASGHDDYVDEMPGGSVVGEAREHLVTARNATLTIPLRPDTYTAYFASARMAAPTLVLHEATGFLPHVGRIVGGEVVLQGGLALQVQRHGAGHLAATLEGTPERVTVNGQDLSAELTGPALPVGDPAGPAVAVAAVTFAALAIAAWSVRAWSRRRSLEPQLDGGKTEQSVPRLESMWRGPSETDAAARRTVLRIVSRYPGISVRDLLARSGMRKTRAHAALTELLERGRLVQRGSESRWYLFVSSPDLDQTWRRQAALAHDDLRLLFGVLQETPGVEQRCIVAACRERWGWSPSTTKGRLRRLAAMGLAEATERVPRGTRSVTWSPAAE